MNAIVFPLRLVDFNIFELYRFIMNSNRDEFSRLLLRDMFSLFIDRFIHHMGTATTPRKSPRVISPGKWRPI